MGTGKADRFWSARARAPLSSGRSESGTVVPRSKTLRGVPRHFQWVGAPLLHDWGARPFYRAAAARRRTRSPGSASRAALRSGLPHCILEVWVRRVLPCARGRRAKMCLAGRQTPRAGRTRSPKAHVPACRFDIHTAIMAYAGAKRKPSIGFQARFFLERSDRRLWLKGNGLQRKKSPKTEKTRKKVQNNFRGTMVFLQKACIFRPKTVPVRRRDL